MSQAGTRIPSPAGIYDCLLGGKNHHPADRAAAGAIRAVLPEAGAAAWANRGFHQRAAIWMARRGIGQFIDLECVLAPATASSTHEAVQKVNPAARVLYVDHDRTVAAQVRALLTTAGRTPAILRDPGALLALVELDGLIDLTAPVGLLGTAVLEHLGDRDDPWGCLAHLAGALAPGSYLALSHLTADQMPPAGVAVIIGAYRHATDPVHPRTVREVARFFDRLELVPSYEGADPELCPVGVWGAEDPVLADDASSRWRWAGVGRVTR